MIMRLGEQIKSSVDSGSRSIPIAMMHIGFARCHLLCQGLICWPGRSDLADGDNRTRQGKARQTKRQGGGSEPFSV